ncbi:MAG TPA: GNAT family N-acetyltransferase [Pirellulales bacterium]|nr:GNAT family N-acetyltransferase [Pirellulales bacterium]
MADVVVKPVSSWFDRQRFVDFAWTLYRGDSNWMPPLRGNQRELLGYKRHPFHDSAEMQTFLAWRNGEVCGRIAAIVNHEHNRVFQENRGFFGFFEAVNDQVVANALFDAARDWLAQRGIAEVRGPANPSMNYECGLLVEGFDSPPTFMMTYNPPYYAELFENYGFRKTHDLLAFIGHKEQLPKVESQLGSLASQAQERCQATVRPLNTKRFTQDVELFLDLYNRSLVAMWGFVPLPAAELRMLAKSMRHLLIPELSLIAEVDGQGVGAIIGLPDYNPRIRAINGRLFPFGFIHLLGNRKGMKRIRVLSINVVPEYQRWGLGLVLMRSLVPKAMELGIEEAEFSWVSEDNTMAVLGLEKGGAKLYKTYRMYDYDAALVGKMAESRAGELLADR